MKCSYSNCAQSKSRRCAVSDGGAEMVEHFYTTKNDMLDCQLNLVLHLDPFVFLGRHGGAAKQARGTIERFSGQKTIL